MDEEVIKKLLNEEEQQECEFYKIFVFEIRKKTIEYILENNKKLTSSARLMLMIDSYTLLIAELICLTQDLKAQVKKRHKDFLDETIENLGNKMDELCDDRNSPSQ